MTQARWDAVMGKWKHHFDDLPACVVAVQRAVSRGCGTVAAGATVMTGHRSRGFRDLQFGRFPERWCRMSLLTDFTAYFVVCWFCAGAWLVFDSMRSSTRG